MYNLNNFLFQKTNKMFGLFIHLVAILWLVP